MKTDFIKVLKEQLISLEKAKDILEYSYKRCNKIEIKEGYSYEEMDKFESLTSRFARLSDIFIQKILRIIEIIDLEPQETVRDRINKAEKKGLIESAEKFKEIRILRNSIAHEYIMEALLDIFKNVLEYTPILFDSVDRVKQYCIRYKKNN
ncbi:MAG: hypothetical protein KAT05_16885 [Spirochaetes bacterium]|nr:hypothetical protein [Spirochaetota bacterium]